MLVIFGNSIGWGKHLICNKKYHFVLPSKEGVGSCRKCEGCCRDNNGKSKLIELQGHMMHGVFHSNGFGHLLCVNGLEMGSNLAGNQIMDFWNRLCKGLQARSLFIFIYQHFFSFFIFSKYLFKILSTQHSNSLQYDIFINNVKQFITWQTQLHDA